jgi:hypothetical protein
MKFMAAFDRDEDGTWGRSEQQPVSGGESGVIACAPETGVAWRLICQYAGVEQINEKRFLA